MTIKTILSLPTLAICSFAALGANPALAQYQQWSYTNSVHPTQTFASEEAAHADILSVGGAYAFVTKEGGITNITLDQATQVYVAPPKDPIYTSDWVYESYHVSGTWSTEAAAKAATEAALATYQCPLNYLQWDASWHTLQTWGGLLPTRQGLTLHYRYDNPWWDSNNQQWVCLSNPNGAIAEGGIIRSRNAGCPMYFPTYGNYKCHNATTASVNKHPLVCRATMTEPKNPRGNPCDVASGDKSLREVDYSGPGLEITREFHSKASTVDAGFGVHWSHNFNSYLVGSVNSWYATAKGAVSASGHVDPVYGYATNKWVSYTGSGREVRLSSGETVLHYPSGAKDYHQGFPFGSEPGMALLLRKVDAAGRTTTIARDSLNRISSITGPFGHVVTFVYDANGNVEKLIDPAGGEIRYEYVAASLSGIWRLIEVTYPDNTFRQYHYEDTNFPDLLTGVTDENGERHTTYAYDASGRGVSSERAGGYGGVSLSYAQSSTTVTDGNGNVTTYNFRTDASRMRDFTSVVHDGTTFSYAYPTVANDAQQRYSSVSDQNGVVRSFTYDVNHKTSETRASGTADARTTTFSYLDDSSDRPTLVTTPSVKSGSLRETEITYNGSGLPTVVEISGYTPSGAAVSRSIGLSYNSYGQVTSLNGPRTDVTDVTTFDYYECTAGDECGQLESVTNSLGHVTNFDDYDDHGRLLEMIDPNGVVTEYTYDERGRTTSVTETPSGGTARVTSYTYDDAGLLASVEAPNGTVLTYDYDAAHNLLTITDNLGDTIEYGYDLNGNRTSEDTRDPSSALRKAVDMTYDARDRVESINSAGSITALVFDALGNLTDETDPNTNDTTHDYDPLNRLVQTVDALSGITAYDYNANDDLTSVEAPNGATTTYVYDDLGNLLSLTSPDTGTTSYTYDAAGNRLSETDANSVTVATRTTR
jgi:YD repeat-containing protein